MIFWGHHMGKKLSQYPKLQKIKKISYADSGIEKRKHIYSIEEVSDPERANVLFYIFTSYSSVV
jgi:hypothetical protein